MKVKIIIEDGIIQEVRTDSKDISVEIVDFNKNNGDSDKLQEEYDSCNNMETANYSIEHCE